MELVILDLKKYLKKNIFPSKTVLVFPPFNGFRRFLIHKLIEDNFASADVAAFSIGQDINRRLVVCYKGLIRADQSKRTPVATPRTAGLNMIETEGQSLQKSSPAVAVYRPPAARKAEARQRVAETKADPSKRSRVRRPDQQMYVPRPKRASFGNEQPRSRSRSSSRTSLENDSCDKKKLSSRQRCGDSISSELNDTINSLSSDQDLEKSATIFPSHTPDKNEETSPPSKTNASTISLKKDNSLVDPNAEVISSETGISTDLAHLCSGASLELSTEEPCKCIPLKPDPDKPANLETTEQLPKHIDKDSTTETAAVSEMLIDPLKEDNVVIDKIKGNDEDECNQMLKKQESRLSRVKETVTENNDGSDSSESDENDRVHRLEQGDSTELEAMETISLSSDRGSTTSSSSGTRDSWSTDSEPVQRHSRHKTGENMEIEHCGGSKKVCRQPISKSQEMNLKNKRIPPNLPDTDVLIISDSSSSSDDLNSSKEQESEVKVRKERAKRPSVVKEKNKKPAKSTTNIHPEDYDWESLYDDSGERLVPDLMEELTNSVGRVRVAMADSDYRSFQSIEERTNDGECVIEVYDFPAEFKTSDLMNIFAAYRNKNFQIKWVDDTHALGVFPSPLMADEVLACTLPYVKTRPLRLAITESRNKARNLILPPLPSVERPKTCTALARRLVTGALGLRLPTSSQEREKERQVLKEAREKRRHEAKQREAAWDGTLTSSNCV